MMMEGGVWGGVDGVWGEVERKKNGFDGVEREVEEK